MSRKTRYLLIGLGFLIFLLLAPAIVLYVRGINYDYASGKFFRTGILAVRSEPSNVTIFLNNKEVKKKSGDIKFLKPGAYDISISAPEYQPWKKHLTVWADQVTWASPAPEKLFLFLKNPTSKQLASGVSDFAVLGNTLATVHETNLSLSLLFSPADSQNFTLPKNSNKLTVSPNENYFLLEDTYSTNLNPLIFDVREKKIYDIGSVFSKSVRLFFGNENNLYAIDSNTFYEVDWKNNSKHELAKNISAVTFLGDTAYALTSSSTNPQLLAMNLQNLRQQVLSENLPHFSTGSIVVDEQKQILLILDQSLYLVNSELEKIADHISTWNFDKSANTLTVVHAGELSKYNFRKNTLEFITRSGQQLTHPQVNNLTSYSFFFKDNQLTAAELDTRSSQNEYVLYSAERAEKFHLDSEAKTLIVLDNGNLKEIKIRK